VSEIKPGRVSGTHGLRDEVKFAARGMMTRDQVKRAVRERDGHKCVKCGMTDRRHRSRYGTAIQVHRTTPGSLYTLDGCVTICAECHGPEPERAPGEVDLEGPVEPRKAFHAPAALFDAMAAYIARTKPQPTDAAVLRLALERFLETEGLWPPKESRDGGQKG
jgi:hypothetical protein